MLIKLKPTTPTGIISNDSELKSVYIVRNGVRYYFSIEASNQVNIELFTIEDIADLKFQVNEKASVVLNQGLSKIVVTAENGEQTEYPYTLTQTAPYAGLFPLITSIQSNSIDSLVGERAVESHDAYAVTIVDLVVESDYQNVSFGGLVYAEFQDIAAINPSIPVDLATSLSSTGFAYYIVGWGDGIGGSDWVSYPDWSKNFLYFRVVEDATKFDTEAVSTIKPSELNQIYALYAPETAVILTSQDAYDNFVTVATAEYPSYTDVATFRAALDLIPQAWSSVGVGQDIEPTDIDSFVFDLDIERAIALNEARSLEIYTLDELYAINKTIAQRLKDSTVSTEYPFIRQYADEILSGDAGYSPQYIPTTLTDMKSEVIVEVTKLFADPKFWLSEDALGFVNTKFIYDRFKYVYDNYTLFDFTLSKETVERIVVALDDLITFYYTYGSVDGEVLLPETYVLLQEFSTILPIAQQNPLPVY